MKKQLFLVSTILLIALSGISQTYNDTTKIPNKQLLKAINLIEKGKVDQKQVEKDINTINEMEASLVIKDSIINLQNIYIKEYKAIKINLDKSIVSWQTISRNFQSNYKYQLKLTRRAKVKGYVTLVLGFALAYVIYK